MANTLLMEQHFERDKNLKASGITIVVCACLFLLFFFVNWKVPEIPKPDPLLEGIEVNIGDNNVGGGSGESQGQYGQPNQDNTPNQPAGGGQPATDNSTDEKDPEGPPATSKTPEKTATIPNPAPVKKPTPAPPAPKPKAVLPNGNPNATGTKPGTGISDKDPRSGTGTGPGSGPGTGPGNNGRPDGKPGGNGNGGVTIKGDRIMTYWPDALANVEAGSVTVSVSVTANGTGRFVDFVKGKFLNSYKNEIMTYLRTAKFNKADHESVIEMTFNFKSR